MTEPDLVTKVTEAFAELKQNCRHRDMTDCGHPDIEHNCMLCHPYNCPLIEGE